MVEGDFDFAFYFYLVVLFIDFNNFVSGVKMMYWRNRFLFISLPPW